MKKAKNRKIGFQKAELRKKIKLGHTRSELLETMNKSVYSKCETLAAAVEQSAYYAPRIGIR